MFSRYHYLNHSHNNASTVYVATVNDCVAGFCSVIHFPHPKAKDIKRIHRLVVLPDYQGCGIGGVLLSNVCNMYPKNRMRLVTSQPALIYSLKKTNKWKLLRKGRLSAGSNTGTIQNKKVKGSTSCNRITTTWEFNHGA
jgi:GNAT superfamily N-acetyltransferase